MVMRLSVYIRFQFVIERALTQCTFNLKDFFLVASTKRDQLLVLSSMNTILEQLYGYLLTQHRSLFIFFILVARAVIV